MKFAFALFAIALSANAHAHARQQDDCEIQDQLFPNVVSRMMSPPEGQAADPRMTWVLEGPTSLAPTPDAQAGERLRRVVDDAGERCAAHSTGDDERLARSLMFELPNPAPSNVANKFDEAHWLSTVVATEFERPCGIRSFEIVLECGYVLKVAYAMP